MFETIGRIERDGDLKFREPDPEGRQDIFLNLSVPGIAIKYRVTDNGAAFVVTRIWRYFTG